MIKDLFKKKEKKYCCHICGKEFDDGTNCIILNMDYLVDVKDLKIKSIVTREQFKKMEYVLDNK